MTTKTIRREYPKEVKTKYGTGSLIGYDEKGLGCFSFKPNDAPELAKIYSHGGPCFTVMLPIDIILKDAKEGEK